MKCSHHMANDSRRGEEEKGAILEMEILSELGRSVAVVDPDKARLDQNVKNILAYKPLLAWIFKEVVSECRDMDLDEIEASIEGNVLISQVYVDSGLSNAGERIDGLGTESYLYAEGRGERIDGLGTESHLYAEGLNKYDIRTYLMLPPDGRRSTDSFVGNGPEEARGRDQPESPKEEKRMHPQGWLKLLINVEGQNEDKPGYDISLRALFYCCRMISAQQGVEFTTDSDDPVKYGNIKKVYSIWICTETAQKRANSIERYSLQRSFLYGRNDDTPRYDILNAVIINISKRHDTEGSGNELIRFLTDLFDERIPAAEKIQKLRREYDLRLTKAVEKEVSEMCNYATAIENRGIEIGIERGMEKGIEKGLKALVCSLKRYIRDFESLYSAVTENEDYRNVTKDEVRKYL